MLIFAVRPGQYKVSKIKTCHSSENDQKDRSVNLWSDKNTIRSRSLCRSDLLMHNRFNISNKPGKIDVSPVIKCGTECFSSSIFAEKNHNILTPKYDIWEKIVNSVAHSTPCQFPTKPTSSAPGQVIHNDSINISIAKENSTPQSSDNKKHIHCVAKSTPRQLTSKLVSFASDRVMHSDQLSSTLGVENRNIFKSCYNDNGLHKHLIANSTSCQLMNESISSTSGSAILSDQVGSPPATECRSIFTSKCNISKQVENYTANNTRRHFIAKTTFSTTSTR